MATELSREILENEKETLILLISKHLESIYLDIGKINGNIEILLQKDSIIQSFVLSNPQISQKQQKQKAQQPQLLQPQPSPMEPMEH